MSGHHPAHPRLPMGNPPPVEHSLGGWNHIGHQAPGVGILPGALNQHPNLMGAVRNMVPQTAHLGQGELPNRLGPAVPLPSSHPAWLNKVPGGSHNGDGAGLPPSTPVNPPPANPQANQLFMQLLANQDRRVAAAVAAAGYCGTNPYQQDMIDLSRPSVERSEPLPLVTGNPSTNPPNVEKESYFDVRNGSVTSESANSVNGEVNSDKRAAAAVSVIAANPSREKSVESKVGKVEGTMYHVGKETVRPTEGSSGDLNYKTDSDKSKPPTSHLKVAPVQTFISHKKVKSVEAIVENLFELGSKKQEADSTNTSTALSDSVPPSQNSNKPNPVQPVPKTDSSVYDPHSESEDGDSKLRRKRKIDTPTRKSMSPPPVKKPLIHEQAIQPVAANTEKTEIPSQLGLTALKPSQPGVPALTGSSPESPTVTTVTTSTYNVTNAVSTTSTSSTETGGTSSADPVKSEINLPIPPPSTTLEAAPVTSSPISMMKEENTHSEIAVAAQQPVSSSPIMACPSSTPIDNSQKDDVKNAFVEVESKMEALFAGIIGSGDEGMPGPSESFGGENPLTPLNESLDLDTSSNIAAVLEAKPSSGKKGRPKGSRNGIRQSSDSIFGTSSTESSPQKGKKQKKKLLKEFVGDSPGKKAKKIIAVAGVKNKGKFQKEPSQQTCDSGSNASSVRIKGPVVHCVGPRESPHHVSIINAPARDDEDQEKVKRVPTGRRKGAQIEGKLTSSGLCSSSFISRCEADNPDLCSWVCVFCKRGPHLNGAGDLFGPYLIDQNDAFSDLDLSEKKKGKHNAMASPPGSQAGMLIVAQSGGESPHYIVWTHEDCVVWASGVQLVGVRLAGLEEAVWAALNTKCHRCRNWGANLGCLRHGCTQRAHYPCALESGWHLDEELFKSTCNLHRV